MNDKVDVLAAGHHAFRPGVAPIATQAKTPLCGDGRRHFSITEASPFIVAHQLHAAAGTPWPWPTGRPRTASRRGHAGVGLRPRLDARILLGALPVQRRQGQRQAARAPGQPGTPLRALPAKCVPEARRAFVFAPSGAGAALMKHSASAAGRPDPADRTRPITDDDHSTTWATSPSAWSPSHHYSAHHPRREQEVRANSARHNKGLRPNFRSVGGTTAAHIYEASEDRRQGRRRSTAGGIEGPAFFESPRGRCSSTRRPRRRAQHYLRKVEKKGRPLHNVEFDVIKDVNDPGKTNKA